jgi:ribonuclease HI
MSSERLKSAKAESKPVGRNSGAEEAQKVDSSIRKTPWLLVPGESPSSLKIYTDGGCSGNPGPGGWAFIILREGTGKVQVLREKWGAEENTTNNRAELIAVIRALESLKRLKLRENVEIITDSQLVQKGMTVWIRTWRENGWLTYEKKPVRNQDLWMQLDGLASLFNLRWTWVRGHDGNKYNERCDKLTQKAVAVLEGSKRGTTPEEKSELPSGETGGGK